MPVIPAQEGGSDEQGDGRASILVVDDLPEKLLVFTTVLEDLGHDLVCARSGAEALKEVLRTDFAAILLDVNMPDIDGFETATLIRQYRRSAQTPIIFVASYSDEIQTLRGYSLGAVDYILSPVVPVILRSKVKVFVDLHLTQRRLRRHTDERVALAAAEAARRVAEENTRRSSFLADASRVLSTSLDAEVAGRKLLEMLVPEFAAGATLALCDPDGRIDLVLDCYAADGTAVTVLRRADTGSGRIKPLLDAIESSATGTQPSAESESPVLPLVIGDRVIGAISLFAREREADQASVDELVERSAIALDNARLYRTLQREIDERRGIQAELQASNRRKDEFLAMLSHELRNPLAPIRTAIDLIRLVAPQDPNLTRAISVTERQVSHLTRLVEDLLDVARINQGKITLQLELLDLRAVIAQAVEMGRPFIEARRHRLVKSIPETPLMLRGDFARLSQVIANLLNNAAKYTDDGGLIEMAVTLPAHGVAVITVRDNGMGIAPDLLPNIFELFQQGTQALDRSQGGLGVGLTLVHRLVELHGGRVEAQSDGAGRGSEFRVTLPRLVEAIEPEQPSTERPAASGRVCRILVVDDNQDATDAMASLLALWGHDVRAVADGAEAIASASVFAPEIVLLDIGLPGMDGYTVAAKLREIPETRSSCVIAVTGYGRQSDYERALDAGCDHHLTKPARPGDISRLIDRWVAAHPAVAEGDSQIAALAGG